MKHTFSGGIVIPPAKENKALTAALPIEEWEPDRLRIPLRQSPGPALLPAVQPGDKVKIGQRVGHPAGDSGVPVHCGVSGTVTAVYAKVGAPGSGLLFVVENTDDLVIKTELKEYDVASVQEGMPVQVKSDATGDRVFPASVSHIAPTAQKAADGSTQSSGSVEFDTEVRLDQPDSGLRVGMNVRMTVVTAERKGVWAVPYDALVTDAQGQTAVYVARPQGEEGSMVAVEVPVDTGLETDFYVEISSGQLAEGDLLLTQPAGILPGAPVTLAPAEGSGL